MNRRATSPSIKSATVGWAAPDSAATGYILTRTPDDGSGPTQFSLAGNANTAYTDTGLDPAAAYTYTVAATYSVSGGGGGASGGTTTGPTSAPLDTASEELTSVTATQTTGDSVTLKWTYQGDAAFEIEMWDTSALSDNPDSDEDNYYWIDTSTGSARSYTVGGLTSGDDYKFRIRADRPDGTVTAYVGADFDLPFEQKPSVTAAPQYPYPFYPIELTITQPTGVGLEIISYNVEWRGTSVPGHGWHDAGEIYQGNLGDDDHPLYNIGNGQSAIFRVQAVYQDGGTSDWATSNQVSSPDDSTTLDMNTAIADPSPQLTLISISGTTAKFEWWIDPDPEFFNQLEYVWLQYNQYGSGTDGWSQLEDHPTYPQVPFPPTFTVTNLTPQTHYDFMIHVNWFNDDVQHDMYAHVDGTTTNGATVVVTPVPAAPGTVAASYIPGKLGPGHVIVHWTNNPPDEAGFEVWRSDNGGPYVQIYTAKADETSYDDTGLTDLGPWTYEVRAVNGVGPSPFTLSPSVSPIGGPDVTAHLTAIRSALFAYASANPANQQQIDDLLYNASPIDSLVNWDIVPLHAGSVSTPNNDGILPDGSRTVTVAGRVYRDNEVNYWLYGCWCAVAGANWLPAAQLVVFYRNVMNTVHGYGDAAYAKEAWFMAGFDGDPAEPASAAIPGVAPGTGDPGKLEWHIGVPGDPDEIIQRD